MERLLQITLVSVIFLEIQGKGLISSGNETNCPENMSLIYLDVNNNNDRICECLPTLLYHSEDDSCYDAYRQGPCPPEHYFVLPPGEIEARCEKNPCSIDGLVLFQGDCHFLWRPGPPCESCSEYLGVDTMNYELRCSNEEYDLSAENLVTSKSCPENTIFRSLNKGDNIYVCECKTGHFYYAANQSCLPVYRQGSCPPEHYFVIPPGEEVPICAKNPCLEDGLVPFQGGCHKLGATGQPCENNWTALVVNMENFELNCIEVVRFPIHPPASGIINAPLKACPEGSRRIFTGFCKHVYE